MNSETQSPGDGASRPLPAPVKPLVDDDAVRGDAGAGTTRELADARVSLCAPDESTSEVAVRGDAVLTQQEGEAAARLSIPVRVVACIQALGIVGVSGLILYATVYTSINKGWRGLYDPLLPLAALLLFVFTFLPFAPRLWRAGWNGIDPEVEKRVSETVESRALLEAVQRYDLLRTETSAVAGAEAGGEPDTTGPDETEDERVHEPTHRGDEARIAARTKERREA